MTCNHYDVLNSEPRIASYLGIAAGQVPPEHYFHLDAHLLADRATWATSRRRSPAA